jgi:glycosyltransferase involved in cell wall biosynthesis
MNKLSIITINYNNLLGLQKTMKSVFDQSWKDYEYIIIDGGSTDGSKEFIELNSNKISYWVSEKDNGIYNAMNKGTLEAKGEYVLYLNSGDFLASTDVLKSVSISLNDFDIIYGDLIIENHTGKKWVKKYNNRISFAYFYIDTLPHQASFISLKLISKYNYSPYVEKFIFCADWYFFFDAVIKKNANIKYISYIISNYNLNGFSSQPSNQLGMIDQKNKILEQQYPLFYNEIKEYFFLKSLMYSRILRLYFRIKGINIEN